MDIDVGSERRSGVVSSRNAIESMCDAAVGNKICNQPVAGSRNVLSKEKCRRMPR